MEGREAGEEGERGGGEEGRRGGGDRKRDTRDQRRQRMEWRERERQSEEKMGGEEEGYKCALRFEVSAHCILSHLKSYQIFVRACHQNKPDDTIDTIHCRQYTIGLQEVKG